MFGDNSSKPTSSSGGGPTFPIFLLPSFNLPFRRGRRTNTFPQQHSPPHESSVPSLSSSPASTADSASTSPTSPTSLTIGTHVPTLALPSATTTTTTTSPRLAQTQPDTLRCGICAADVAFASQIVSKGFTGRHGRAYLVSPPSALPTPSCPGSPLNDPGTPGSDINLVNVRVGRPDNRQLVTGAHVVADITCLVCGAKLGWKYVDAREPAQKYKVGKFILETQRVVAFHTWEDVKDGPGATHQGSDELDLTASPPDDDDEEEEEVVTFDSEDEDECEDIFAGVWNAEVVAKRRKSKVANLRKGSAGAVS
ncbi:yippee-like protein [Diplogelasinospora grovesii]|uniref:Yippee-like protein n=1 Tax=Diplogelasinospora grovesii TaxID=303347 RepID=A0AAN6MYZ8_9PEZI|nr:yippee-like protein [Diplogelasinospora grovesii]